MHCVAHVLFSAINLTHIPTSALAGRHEGHPDGKNPAAEIPISFSFGDPALP